MSISNRLQEKLIAAARAIQVKSYSPYSHFPVGAALLTAHGEIVCGVNVENASYGLTICAERSAISTMISLGEVEITAVAVTSPNGVTPCGACRQVLVEFAPQDIPVWMIATESGTITQTSLYQLLPQSFNKMKLDEGRIA